MIAARLEVDPEAASLDRPSAVEDETHGFRVDLVFDFEDPRRKRVRRVVVVHRHGALPLTFLLAHTPKRLLEAQQLAVPAVISGHTHGGQIVLPGIGAVAAREFPVIAGVAQRQGTSIFVSRGVGTVYVPVRINCPPEVALLTLEPVLHS